MKTYVLKSMTLSEILDTAANLLQNRFTMLMTISAFAMIPVELVSNLVGAVMMPEPLQPGASEQVVWAWLTSAIPAISVQVGFFLILVVIVMPITEAAIVHAIASEYLGKPATASECMGIGFRRFAALIGTGFLKSIIVGLTMLLFFFPGLYFLYKYTFSSEAVVIEEKSGMSALTRSGELMTDNFGTAFVLGLVMFVVYMMGGVAGGFVPTMVGKVIVQVVVNAVLFTYGIATSVVFYFSCRCKLENFDLAILAHAVGAEAPAVEVAPATTQPPPFSDTPPSDSLPR